MYKKICTICNKEFDHLFNHTKTCSDKCRNIHTAKKWGRFSDKSISSGTVGAISEMAVSVYLMSNGYAVFRALSPSCACDLIVWKNENIYRVEVRTGYIGVNGKVSYPKALGDKGRQDIYAVYIRNEKLIKFFTKDGEEIEL